MQLLSGTATASRRHVRAIEGASPNPRGCAILDTRKTIPGLRQAQKYAVRILVNPDAVSARGLSLADVRNAVSAGNSNSPVGPPNGITQRLPLSIIHI